MTICYFFSAQSQLKEFGRVYEKTLRRLETVEIDFKRSCDDVEGHRRRVRELTSQLASMEEENAFLKRRRVPTTTTTTATTKDNPSRREKILNQAIVFERNGEVSSPFVK